MAQLTKSELNTLLAELDRNPLRIPGTGKLIAEEEDGVVYLLREGGRQPVAMMPRDTYDQLKEWDPTVG